MCDASLVPDDLAKIPRNSVKKYLHSSNYLKEMDRFPRHSSLPGYIFRRRFRIHFPTEFPRAVFLGDYLFGG